jgi:hypothetical protein
MLIIIANNNNTFIIIFYIYLCHPLTLIGYCVYAYRRRRGISDRNINRRKVGVIIEGEVAALINNNISNIV